MSHKSEEKSRKKDLNIFSYVFYVRYFLKMQSWPDRTMYI